MTNKNTKAKTVKPVNAYEVWSNGRWTWLVLKHYQSTEQEAKNKYARVLCLVDGQHLDIGDVYLHNIEEQAVQLEGAEAQAERIRVSALWRY